MRLRVWAIFGVLACMIDLSAPHERASPVHAGVIHLTSGNGPSSQEELIPRPVHRSRRAAMNSEEIAEAINTHNRVRRQEGASNMHDMIWNSYLASMAEDWSNTCNFIHGQPYRDPATLPYSPIGQNLYAFEGATMNVTVAIEKWYDEKQYYTYDNMGCEAGQMCGHYTQVVWSTSREVGCASSQCAALGSTALTNAAYFVCNYGPAGNYVGTMPYKKGLACTTCASGSGWCNNGLCTENCASLSSNCACDLECFNCGSINTATCGCQCKPGWTGNNCTAVCRDLNPYCGTNPGWPPKWCDEGHQYVLTGCPAMCGSCDPAPSNVTCLQPNVGSGYRNGGQTTALSNHVTFHVILLFVVTFNIAQFLTLH